MQVHRYCHWIRELPPALQLHGVLRPQHADPSFPDSSSSPFNPDRSRVAFVNVLQEGNELWTRSIERIGIKGAVDGMAAFWTDLVSAGLYFSVDGNGSQGIRWINTKAGRAPRIAGVRVESPIPLMPDIVYLHLTGQRGHLVLLDLLRRRPRRLTTRVGAYVRHGYEPPLPDHGRSARSGVGTGSGVRPRRLDTAPLNSRPLRIHANRHEPGDLPRWRCGVRNVVVVWLKH